MKEKKISLIMNKEELELLEEVTIFEPFIQDITGSAKKVDDDRYEVKALSIDLKEATDALSFASGSIAEYPKNEKMVRLSEKIQARLILKNAI